MRMLSSTMIKLLNVNEQPQKFFASEEERLKEIKQEFPDNEFLALGLYQEVLRRVVLL
jgi:hypothetical protein